MTKKGEQVPQTVEHLQKIMADDAVTMMKMAAEISKLKTNSERLRAKLSKARGRHCTWTLTQSAADIPRYRTDCANILRTVFGGKVSKGDNVYCRFCGGKIEEKESKK